ncbi:MAG: LCP family protein [Syntrophomonadaceae bacterium]|jgi:LCP family protein required for cell wall assembly
MLKIKFFCKFMLLAGAVFGMFFGIGAGLTGFVHSTNLTREDSGLESPIAEAEEELGHRINILILGVDARSNEEHSRSDTIMLVSVDPELKKIALVSIPRDTRVDINANTRDKINAAYYYGGVERAESCVEDLMGINIDNYVELDFNGFKKAVDLLGGVTYDVPQRMYKPSEDIDLHAGVQKLNGRQALGLVRFRDYVMGDIERTAQQQEFLKALANEALQPKNIVKIPKIATELRKYIETDLTASDMVKLASWAPRFRTEDIVAQTLPGNFYDERDSYGNIIKSYWLADPEEIDGLLEDMLTGQTVAVHDPTSPETEDVTSN